MIKSITARLSLLILLIAITTCYYERETDQLKVCYEINHDILTMDIDGSNQHRITFDGTNYCPSWSPDGQKILFYSDRGLGANPNIYIMNSDGSAIKKLTNTYIQDISDNPTWSSDGENIIYSRFISTMKLGFIYITKTDGTILKKFQTGSMASSKTMSIDGRFVYYSKSHDFCRMDLSTGTEENYRNTLSYYADYVSISPDGRYVLCAYNGVIFIYEIITQSTTNLASGSDPCWTPDGETIIYVSGGNIFSINIDGTNQKPLTTGGGCSSPCVQGKPR